MKANKLLNRSAGVESIGNDVTSPAHKIGIMRSLCDQYLLVYVLSALDQASAMQLTPWCFGADNFFCQFELKEIDLVEFRSVCFPFCSPLIL